MTLEERQEKIEATQREMADILRKHVADFAASVAKGEDVAARRETEFQARRAEDIARHAAHVRNQQRAGIAADVLGVLIGCLGDEVLPHDERERLQRGVVEDAVAWADALLEELAK